MELVQKSVNVTSSNAYWHPPRTRLIRNVRHSRVLALRMELDVLIERGAKMPTLKRLASRIIWTRNALGNHNHVWRKLVKLPQLILPTKLVVRATSHRIHALQNLGEVVQPKRGALMLPFNRLVRLQEMALSANGWTNNVKIRAARITSGLLTIFAMDSMQDAQLLDSDALPLLHVQQHQSNWHVW